MADEVNSIKQYLKEINEINLLTFEEEKRLAKEIAKGNQEAK